MILNCCQCGTDFVRSLGGHELTCSPKCRRIRKNTLWNAGYHDQRYTKKSRRAKKVRTRNCTVCGEPFDFIYPATNVKTCSPVCRAVALARYHRERESLRRTALKTIEVNCPDIDLAQVFCEVNGRPHRSITELCNLAVQFVDVAGARKDVEANKETDGWGPLRQKTCLVCKGQFSASHSSQKTCSVECQKIHNTAVSRVWRGQIKVLDYGPVRACAECGNSFPLRHINKYCSKECAHTANIRNMREWRLRNPELPPAPRSQKCPECGKSFSLGQGQGGGKRSFCSHQCSTHFHYRRWKEQHPKPRKRRLAGKTQTQSTAKPGSPQWQNLSLTT